MKYAGILLLFIVLATSLNWRCASENRAQRPMVQLGKALFFEKRLSANSTKSCASCHAPEFAFTDGYKKSLGIEADIHPRNAPSLLNTVHYRHLNWATPHVTTFEQQMEGPLFNVVPLEMGANKEDNSIPERLAKDSGYVRLFRAAFPNEKHPFTWQPVINAIATYCRTLTSQNSPYDQYVKGDENALSEAAKRGEKLFLSARLKCAECHKPPFFTVASDTGQSYFNIGLYEDYPDDNEGLYEATQNPADKGKFRVPSLRNLVFTAPYMHDGSVANLQEVVAIYQRAGRHIETGENAGRGSRHPNKDPRIMGFFLSETEKADLIAFLVALSDSTVLRNPHFKP